MLTRTTGVTAVCHITTKKDMSRWTRAHAEVPGITWTVQPAPGGTMLITEHETDRRTLPAPDTSPPVSVPGRGVSGPSVSPAGRVASWAA